MKYDQYYAINQQVALEAVKIALAEGAKQGVSVSVAVVDPNMLLVAFGRASGATPHSIETSQRKAKTAASTRKVTGWMSSELAVTLPLASGNMLTNVPGGFPIITEGKLIGALGIAGGTIEQDAAIARAVLETLGAELTL